MLWEFLACRVYQGLDFMVQGRGIGDGSGVELGCGKPYDEDRTIEGLYFGHLYFRKRALAGMSRKHPTPLHHWFKKCYLLQRTVSAKKPIEVAVYSTPAKHFQQSCIAKSHQTYISLIHPICRKHAGDGCCGSGSRNTGSDHEILNGRPDPSNLEP